MSAALVEAMAPRGGGTLVLIDAVPELLDAARDAAVGAAQATAGDAVEVRTVRGDIAQLVAPTGAADHVGNGHGHHHAQHEAAHDGAAQHGTAQRDAAHDGAAQHGTAQHKAVQDGSAQHDPADQHAGAGELSRLPKADLIWASNVVHHLPDQGKAIDWLAGLLASGGCLALAEGGLPMSCLPWDLGIGEPGLQGRLATTRSQWFRRMRADIPGAVRLPVGWSRALADAGLDRVTAFSYLVDIPAPLPPAARDAVVAWLDWMSGEVGESTEPSDVAVTARLLDPNDPAYVGARDDIFILKTHTVYIGWAR
jgi:SAM-dependent methyltransferase